MDPHSSQTIGSRVKQCHLERGLDLLVQLSIVLDQNTKRLFRVDTSELQISTVLHVEVTKVLCDPKTGRATNTHQRVVTERTRHQLGQVALELDSVACGVKVGEHVRLSSSNAWKATQRGDVNVRVGEQEQVDRETSVDARLCHLLVKVVLRREKSSLFVRAIKFRVLALLESARSGYGKSSLEHDQLSSTVLQCHANCLDNSTNNGICGLVLGEQLRNGVQQRLDNGPRQFMKSW